VQDGAAQRPSGKGMMVAAERAASVGQTMGREKIWDWRASSCLGRDRQQRRLVVASILWRLQWQKASRETGIPPSSPSYSSSPSPTSCRVTHPSNRLTREAAIARNRKPSTPIQYPSAGQPDCSNRAQSNTSSTTAPFDRPHFSARGSSLLRCPLPVEEPLTLDGHWERQGDDTRDHH
jgi:hypothetical protein